MCYACKIKCGKQKKTNACKIICGKYVMALMGFRTFSTVSHPQIAHRKMSDILTFFTFFLQPVPGPTIFLGILAPTLLTS